MSRPKKSPVTRAPAGTYDVVPEDQKFWRYVFKKAELLLDDYGFDRLQTAPLELAGLFLRAAPSVEEVISEELVDMKISGESAAVRPGGPVPVMRAYLEHGMNTRPHPIKLFSSAPAVRYDSAQGGLRQFHDLSVQTIGDASEVVDAELLFLAYKILDSVGLHSYNVHINSIGDNNCRPAWVRALKDFYKNRLKKVCAKCRNNFKTNILRMLECSEADCRDASKEAPQSIDFLDEDCKNHFKRILEFLDAAQIPYILNNNLVRSADHCTRTVFEFWPEPSPAEPAAAAPGARAVVSGGRYDKLSELLGGPKTPSAGWSLEADQIVAGLKEKNVSVPEVGMRPKVFLVQLGEAAKRKSLLLFEDIRKSGIEIRYSLSRDSIKSQLRIASRYGVRFTLIFGQKEAIENTVILREMETGIQETIPLEKIIDELKKRLKK